MYKDLINHPPRLSDLRGEALEKALRERHDANEQRWLQNRQPKPLLARLFKVVRKERELAA
jgi:hypothetical protein